MTVFGEWIDRGEELRHEFEEARPFPLLVIDGFVRHELAEQLLAEFPSPDAMPRSRDYVFGDKRELSSVADRGPAAKELYDALVGDRFKRFMKDLTGKDLFVDPAFHGGGFHQSGDGGYLDMHVDFNVHPLQPSWLRCLNILLYLNKDWETRYSGQLLVRSDPDEEPRAIDPLFNRGVIMVTNDHTWHGFRRMALPPGITRKSIATYAYELVDPAAVRAHTTGWAPESAGPLKRFLANHYDTAVRWKSRFLGSRTAKNR